MGTTVAPALAYTGPLAVFEVAWTAEQTGSAETMGCIALRASEALKLWEAHFEDGSTHPVQVRMCPADELMGVEFESADDAPESIIPFEEEDEPGNFNAPCAEWTKAITVPCALCCTLWTP